jgi:YfiH family protein
MLQRIAHDNGLVTYQSVKLREAGVIHGFSTRIGGLSEGPYASLNLATLEKSEQSDFNTYVAENFRRFRRALGVERHMRAAVRQAHGAEVWVPPAGPIRPQDFPEADALVSDQPDKLLVVRVADCLPVLLSSRDGRVAAAVHAGWRGLTAGVIPATVATMTERFGVPVDELVAALGPAIRVEAFEVGEEVAEAFIQAGLGQAVDRRHGPKPHVNLSDAGLMQLLDAGLSTTQLEVTDRCTYRDADEFFSHRRDEGQTGRMVAALAPGGGSAHPQAGGSVWVRGTY